MFFPKGNFFFSFHFHYIIITILSIGGLPPSVLDGPHLRRDGLATPVQYKFYGFDPDTEADLRMLTVLDLVVWAAVRMDLTFPSSPLNS